MNPTEKSLANKIGNRNSGTGLCISQVAAASPGPAADAFSDLSLPIPFSKKYHHFDAGQTETTLNLPLGKHTLQLLFADHDHRPLHGTKSGTEIVVHRKKITITVEEPARRSQK
ncbi:DUF4399 domain-containing protein [Noviherbaspirillum sp.]|uniref:DUF4399 domain-containing protein n=1 Tax=Noviherbaspirillum sp. TaxID=1926288 RepID=UPI002FE3BBAB